MAFLLDFARSRIPTRRQSLGLGVVAAVNVALAVLGMTRALQTGFVLGTLGVICSFIGGAIFWVHGGRGITAAGVVGLSCVVFVGISAIQWSMQDSFELSAIVIVACVSTWLALVWVLFWHDSVDPLERGARPVMVLNAHLAKAMILVGVVMTVLFGVASRFDYAFSGTVPFQLSLGAMTLLITAVLLSHGSDWHPVLQLSFVLLLVVIASVTLFTGYGRLNLVTLGLVGVVLVSRLNALLWLKPVLLAGVGPALLVLAYMRRLYFERTYGVTTNGAESVFTPLRDAAELYHRLGAGVTDNDHGRSFLVALIFWVPRVLWENKPQGFGAVLVEALGRDGYAPANQSYAALFIGEWFFAGGWLAVALSVAAVGVVVRLLDGWLDRLVSRPRASDPQWLLLLTVALIMVAELANYVWVGSFGYSNRAVLRAAPVVLVLILWYLVRRIRARGWKSKSSSPRGTPEVS